MRREGLFKEEGRSAPLWLSEAVGARATAGASERAGAVRREAGPGRSEEPTGE